MNKRRNFVLTGFSIFIAFMSGKLLSGPNNWKKLIKTTETSTAIGPYSQAPTQQEQPFRLPGYSKMLIWK